MTFWSPESIRATIGGVWHARPPAGFDRPIEGASMDSRTVRAGEVFFALAGERTDGHAHVRAAAEAGAAMAVVESPERVAPEPPEGFPVLRVERVVPALGRLAAAYRRRLRGLRLVGITGSNGKTTTTRLVDAALASVFRGRCPERSYNNEIGLPLTLLSVRRGDQYLVCELGTNAPGEIDALAQVAKPDVGVITSIGRAHLERLGSLEGVAAEKAAMLGHLEPGALAVVSADAPTLAPHLRAHRRLNIVTVGRSEDADVRVGDVEPAGVGGQAGIAFTLNGHTRFEVPLLGAHNALNAAMAVVVARRYGLTDDRIRAGLAGARGPAMRLSRSVVGSVVVINDAYNANPDSMRAALEALASMPVAPGGRRVAVLADMLELGEDAPGAHRELGELVGAGGVDAAVFVGPLSVYGAERARRAMDPGAVAVFPDLESGRADEIASLFGPGDVVLLKGSRGMRLEAVGEAIRRRASPEPCAAAGGDPR